jgi:hypothetical protein
MAIMCTFVLIGCTESFVSPPNRHSRYQPNSLPAMRYSSHNVGDEAISNAREALERQLGNGFKSIIRDGIIAQAKSKHLFLTSADRCFREVEMELLRSLESSDAALEELVHLWTTERDSGPANDLLHMQEFCSDGLVLEEARLWEMTHEYPGWAEPYARLATLFYYKGPAHAHRAAEMANRALELKPWHFEALNLLVQIFKQNNDAKTALEWSRLAVPPLRPNDPNCIQLRKKWVAKALEQAAMLWEEAEHATNAIHNNQKPKFIMDEAWQ